MQKANRLQKALKTGNTSFGVWQSLPGSNLSRTLARTPNVDWVLVDCEHGNLSDDAMHEAVAAIAACGVSPVVRIPEGQHWWIKRVLDAGAHGVLIPLIHNVEDARRMVQYSKFPPWGSRGLGSAFSMEKWAAGVTGEITPISMADYYRDANESIVIILQIETASALEQVEAIAATEGVDVLLVGPMDLGNSIGHPILLNGGKQAPELIEAIAKINKAAHDHKKWSAIYTGDGAAAKAYAQQGFNMVNVLNDVVLLKTAVAHEVNVAIGK